MNPLAVPEFPGRALCAEVDGDVWFPEPGGNPRDAKAICADCEVQPECLQWAIDNREPYGVWGGLTATERRKLRPPKPRPMEHGTANGYNSHYERGEKPCDACRAAYYAAQKRRRDAKKRAA